MSHVTHMNESCHISMSHTAHMNEHGTHINESCHTYMHESCHTYRWIMSHIYMGRLKTAVGRYTYEWIVVHISMSHSAHINELFYTWMSHVTHMNGAVKELGGQIDINKLWHTPQRVIPHIWMNDGTHINELCHTYEWVMSHTSMNNVTHMNGALKDHSRQVDMGWLRLVGSLKL